jgi:hypothetical protein
MAKDDRDILNLLQDELDFIEKGGSIFSRMSWTS